MNKARAITDRADRLFWTGVVEMSRAGLSVADMRMAMETALELMGKVWADQDSSAICISPLPGDSIDKKELKRRAEMLAATATRCGVTERLCRFCGKPKTSSGLASHLRRRHGQELAELPAQLFG